MRLLGLDPDSPGKPHGFHQNLKGASAFMPQSLPFNVPSFITGPSSVFLRLCWLKSIRELGFLTALCSKFDTLLSEL